MQAEPLDGDPPMMMRAVKPALKHDRSQKKKKKDLKWDEEVIAEHDQLRGTRMKVRIYIFIHSLFSTRCSEGRSNSSFLCCAVAF